MKIYKKQVLIYVLIAALFTSTGYYINELYHKQQKDAATQVAKNFVSDLTAGKTSDAYILTSNALKAVQSQKDFNSGFSGLKATTPSFQTAAVLTGNKAVIYQQKVTNMPVTTGGSTNAQFSVTLVSEGGNWKVDNVIVQ